jgi:hypothetical protein
MSERNNRCLSGVEDKSYLLLPKENLKRNSTEVKTLSEFIFYVTLVRLFNVLR